MGKANELTFQNDLIKQLRSNGWLLGKPDAYNLELALYPEYGLGSAKAKDKKEEFLSHIISRLNELFITDELTDKDLVNYAYTVRDKVSENKQVMDKIANNSPKQAMFGDFTKAIDDAVMDSSEAQRNQMMQILSDPTKASNFVRIVFDLLQSSGGRSKYTIVFVYSKTMNDLMATPVINQTTSKANKRSAKNKSNFYNINKEKSNVTNSNVIPLVEGLPYNSFSASSVFSNNISTYGPVNAMYSSKSAGANWIPLVQDNKQWLEIDLTRKKTIYAVGTKGDYNTNRWVKAHKLSYSSDGNTWEVYKENGKNYVFYGNSDRDTENRHKLKSPINTRYVKFSPVTWNTYIAMRVEIYGN